MHALSGVSGYRDAAEQAMRYERHWFSAKNGNWPDFREDPGNDRRAKRAHYPYPVLWCHGAPGIALARLRVYELLNDQICLEEARIAIHTASQGIHSALASRTGNYSLCHGLAGNADVLLEAGRAMGAGASDHLGLCQTVASAGSELHASGGPTSWPCGTQAGQTPNLMLGLAGIGHFYLRLEHEFVAPILLLKGATVSAPPSPPGTSGARRPLRAPADLQETQADRVKLDSG
jgi:lantibiotic modifying enzyme